MSMEVVSTSHALKTCERIPFRRLTPGARLACLIEMQILVLFHLNEATLSYKHDAVKGGEQIACTETI